MTVHVHVHVLLNSFHLKGHSHVFFLYFCHKLAEFISNDLAHASIIAFRLLKKKNQMNFERKTSQNQVFY